MARLFSREVGRMTLEKHCKATAKMNFTSLSGNAHTQTSDTAHSHILQLFFIEEKRGRGN